MILVDTSIWVDHLRAADAILGRLLLAGRVLIHPFVIGEIALGVFATRSAALANLQNLPVTFIAVHSLAGAGIGLVDTHLLAGVSLTPGSTFWTRDNKLLAAARRIGVAASP